MPTLASKALTAGIGSPDQVTSDDQFFATVLATWALANLGLAELFAIPVTKTYRYVNLRVGASSGNIQAGIVRVHRQGTNIHATLLGSSGVIACPTANSDQRIDMGAAGVVVPGNALCALFLWCDNTTASFLTNAIAGYTASRRLLSFGAVSGGIVAATEYSLATTTRFVTGIGIETDG